MTKSQNFFDKEKVEKQARLLSKVLIYSAIIIAIVTPLVIIIDYITVRGALAEAYFVFMIIFGFVLLSCTFIWLFIQYRKAVKLRGG